MTKLSPKVRAGALCTLALLMLPAAAPAKTGDRDVTFNGTGESRLDSGGMDDSRAIVRQPDGKLVVVGDTSNSFSARVHRLNADGTLDQGFGDKGTVVIDSGAGEDHLTSVLVQPDGKVVLGGSATGQKAVLYRLTAGGGPDQGFGVGGRVTLTTDAKVEKVHSLALQPDGKIVAAGASNGPVDGIVWRRSGVDGSPDVVFNAPPSVRINLGADESANSVAIDRDGRVLVAGNTSANSNGFVTRLTPQLAPDPAFQGGTVVLDSGAQEFAVVVKVQPDGKVVVGGRSTFGATPNAVVYRLKDNGEPDLGFNQTGTRFIDSGGDEAARDVLVAPDGKLVVIGQTTVNNDGAIYRLTPTGAFDLTFDGDGALGIDSGGIDTFFDGLLEPDGNIVAAGASKLDGVVYRLLGDPFPLTVSKNGSGAGSVVSDPRGIDCGGTCTSTHDVGTRVTLAAVPAQGSTFAGWTGGGCPASPVCRVELRSAVKVTATFNANPAPAATATPTPKPTTTGRGSTTTSGTTANDTTAPRVSAAKLSNRSFRLGNRRTALATAVKRGTSARFTLSEDAAVTLTITRGNRTVVTLTRSGATRGQNLITYTGRTTRGALKSGRYRMTLTATDRAGNRSSPVTLPFRVLKG
jgi:uncharacterized delta-60 repeat protein